MHESQTRVVHVIIGGVAEVPCEGVDECAVVIAVSGVHDKSGRLVYHKHVSVFINNVERYILGDDLEFISWTVHYDLHHIERLHPIVTLYGFSVYKNAACLGGLLHAVARRFLKPGDKKFVYPEQFLTFIGHKAEMLKVFYSADFHYFALGGAFVFNEFFVGHSLSLLS